MKENIIILFECCICSFLYAAITGHLTTEDTRFIFLWIGIVNILDKLKSIGGKNG